MNGMIVCAVLALVGCLLVIEADAFCCGSSWGVCGDCTSGTPCCATRPCNIFCCACKGVCRSGGCAGRRRRSPEDDVTPRDNTTASGHDVIRVGDLNQDGHFDFDEAVTYVTEHKGYDRETAKMMLIELDLDNNKIFTVEEIDE